MRANVSHLLIDFHQRSNRINESNKVKTSIIWQLLTILGFSFLVGLKRIICCCDMASDDQKLGFLQIILPYILSRAYELMVKRLGRPSAQVFAFFLATS